MANTYTSLYYHIVFSTKDREPWITTDIEREVWTYLAGLAAQHGIAALDVGGLDDHVHLVLAIPPTSMVSKAAQLLKGASSRWVRQRFPGLEAFRWQDGYGAFTISKEAVPATVAYVQRQRAAHEARTYQEELRLLLQRHDIDYDERYLWS
jgi:REP element-mobilizing transposase RayT